MRDADPMIGRVLDGRYRVGRRIARGGMATVYEAHDLRLDRECAVKLMLPDLGDDHDFASRFVREAHSAARLAHPNVVSVTDQGDDHGQLFLVMEHVRGRTLRDVISDEAPLPPDRALELLEPILAALAEAHRCGIVHRDIKPENVLIAHDGRVKVADFGLARAVNANTQHTKTGGVLIGTVSYLAPEIIVNSKADPRSDVYAAGVLLYEMLTGRKPHEGEGAIQIAFKHVNEDIPAPSLATEQPLPAYVDALVARATARDRERRPADAKVLLHQVRRVRSTIAAGITDDPELTADLLPSAPALEDTIDYVADPTVPVAPWGEPAEQQDQDDDEATAVIDARARALAASGAGMVAGAGTGAGTGELTEPVLPVARESSSATPGVSPRPGGPSGGTPAAGSRPAPRRPRRGRRGPLLLALLLALTVLAAYGGWWLGIGRYTSTPGVINLSVAAATTKLDAAGLDLAVADREFSETVVAGSVISTDPGAGARILKGGTVEIVVSLGPERYEVPKLRGKKLTDVPALLTEVNLQLGQVTEEWNENVPEGVVIQAIPGAGTEVRRDTSVDVRVSKGPKPIKIPDFTGKDADRAEQKLTALGFEVNAVEENSDTVEKGRVISQDPASGIGHRDDVVNLVVSKGPVLVAVPNLQADSVAAATRALDAVGLKVAVVRTQYYIGLDRVVRQSPRKGELIPKGSVVTIYIV